MIVPLIATMNNFCIFQILSKFASFINVKIPPEYRDQFINADRMFQYQPIYDPLSHNLKPLNEMPDSNIPVLNSTLTSDLVHQLVLGNMDPISLEIMDNWNPEMRIVSTYLLYCCNYLMNTFNF